MALLLSPTYVMRTPSHLAVVHTLPSFVWLMDLRREHPSMDLLKIYSSIKENMLLGTAPLGNCILDAHPEADGRFLFATRSEKAVLFTAMQQPKPKDAKDIQDPLFKMDLALHQRLSVTDEPDLEWWELDPWEKNFLERPTPAGIPERLTNPEEVRRFRFWYTVSGHVASTLSRYVPGGSSMNRSGGPGTP